MIRNLKVLLLAAMALAAFGAMNASGAQAAEELFHCSAEPCRITARQDGTGTTGHQVFVIKNSTGETLSFTCKVLEGDATNASKTSERVTLTGILYKECNGNGEPVKVTMNGCNYEFTSKNGAPANATGAEIHVECEGTKHIEIEITATGCIFEVTPQTLVGARYHNIPFDEATKEETKEEVTVEANKIKNITVESVAGNTKAKCLIDPTKTPLSSEYLTGNAIATGETDPVTGTPVMGTAWWA